MEQTKATLEQEAEFSRDLLAIKPEERNWKVGNYFSIWMGSIHNVPSYVTIGGFFALGLSVGQVFWVIMIASFILAIFMVLNGYAGTKYGIPFSMLLRTSYGVKGAMLPGILRGCIAAIMWFGFQTYAGSIAFTIFIGKLWPPYLKLGGEWSFLGLSIPALISFLIFWMLNVSFIYGGMQAIGKFTKFLLPLVYLVFGGMAIWAIKLAGGITPILHYTPKGIEGNSLFVLLACVSAVLAIWASPIVNVSDFTREARSQRDQTIGQISGIVFAYLLFAIASITLIVGSEIAFGTPIWNVLDVVERFDNKFAIAVSVLTICLTSLSVNITGNIIPAGLQLSALFPKRVSFKTGALIAAVAGLIIMPWKLMENSTSIFLFLNIIGGLLGPVTGVMLAHYYVIAKKEINMEELYSVNGKYHYKNGFHMPALIATVIAGAFSLSGQFFPALKLVYHLSFFSGTIVAFILYIVFVKRELYVSGKMQKREDVVKGA
ncbi:NCS1 family nucleobase:cation symporter [Peribacillus sp. SI8-4]|uniref:allantoin permease n=1 Tax=Peribacillus sp. SI8-4 TaxID=3048009 RepID=UPI0025568796|nr:NCS1 family nucleobase:cation symporter [Peribacillus sp. SI8-4]